MASYKKAVKNLYPNAECVWRDGPRISYEIMIGGKCVGHDFSLSSKSAWYNVFVTLFKK